MATIVDVAKAAEVSIATVSNVLNNQGRVGEQTRQRVLEACKSLNYYPNFMARNLRSGKTNTVLFSFSDFNRYFYMRIIHGISDCMNENGYGLIVCDSKTVQNFLQSKIADGAIILDRKIKDSQILDAAGHDMNVVLMDRELTNPYVSSVLTDNESPMIELVTAMVKKGYQRFAYVSGVESTLDHKERYGAFCAVLKQHGIVFTEDQYYTGDYTEESGKRAGNLMAIGGAVPQAIVCENDNMASGVLQTLLQHGYSVPEEVAVTGFDGEALPELLPYELTTALIPRYESGYLAAGLLLKKMNGVESPPLQRIKAAVRWGNTTH